MFTVSQEQNYCSCLDECLPVLGRAIAQEVRVRSRANPCEICGGPNGTGTGFSRSISAVPYQYRSTDASYSAPT
jgi:hypothetical protein